MLKGPWWRVHTHTPTLRATRWFSRIDAVKPLGYHLEEIFDALLEISDNNSSEWDYATSHKAHSLALSIQNYRFTCSIIICTIALDSI
ncbi:unnamed protein product [Acanthoscelides obtectus]|uniref:Uncharacterized protein n=1 Tax=Acanthoscelides obtectus TaxID=200917 RepID=A0A9P0LUJ4_ACAOB|nr:unnamed protein product [Acanthoscelides obtectus]CAK1672717.1 hypothetical protein AOBTE_LOCUS29064 [Acanthoscelides obtectus]